MGPLLLVVAGAHAQVPADVADVVVEDDSRVRLSFTNDFELRLLNFDPTPLVQVDGPPPKTFEEVNRFTARAGVGRWSFNLQIDQVAVVGAPYRLDGELVSEPPALELNCGLESCVQSPFPGQFGRQVYLNPEKLAVSYDSDDFDLTLGDFYAAFGYGAALNLNRNVDIDVDTSIQGLRLVASPGSWELTGMAGTLNRQQVFSDNQNIERLESGRLQGDLRHLIAGARVVRHDIGPAVIGLHTVAYDFVDLNPTAESPLTAELDAPEQLSPYGFEGMQRELFTSTDAVIGGATLELYGVAGIDWQFEADLIGFPLNEDGQSILFIDGVPEPGHSLYGSASFFTGAAIWQVDVKKYKNFQRVNRPLANETYLAIVPPTLEYERAINFNTAASVGSDDIWGGRIRMDLALGDLTPYVAVSGFRDEDLENAAQKSPAPETIFQGQGGFELLLDDLTILTNALGRTEMRDDDLGSDVQIYGDLDVKFPLWKGAHADVIVFGQRFLAGPSTSDVFQGEVPDPDATGGDWTETSFSLTVAPTHNVGITGYFDYTTNPFAQAGGNLWSPYTFGAAELYFKPSSTWTIRAFHGGYASGIRCSGGQCRFVPAFTGTRLAITGTF